MTDVPSTMMWLVKGRGQESSIHPPTHQGDSAWSLSGSWQKSMLHWLHMYTTRQWSSNKQPWSIIRTWIGSTYKLFSPNRPCDSQHFAVKFVHLSLSLRSCYCLSCFVTWTSHTHGQLNSRMKEFADYAQGRNLKSYWEHRKSMKKNVEVHYRSETLPRSVINHVNCSLFGKPGMDIV